MSATHALPPAITLQEFGRLYEIPDDQLHRVVRILPPDCTFRIGKRWRVLVGPTAAWVNAGGSLGS